MKRLLEVLIDEHGAFGECSHAFEAQLSPFEEAQTPDYEILEGTIAYCREYLDWWPHPREDALLEILHLRMRPAAAGNSKTSMHACSYDGRSRKNLSGRAVRCDLSAR